MLIDPVPVEIVEILQKNIVPITGGLDKIGVMFINHQDPDVALNSSIIQNLNPRDLIIASEDTWRLIRFYGLKSSRFKAVESFKLGIVRLAYGHRVKFIPTPFCHFRGAVMLYDLTSQILFSGDLFGGLSYSQELYASEDSWEGILR